ncbi:MAG: hypothetical protein PHG35_09455 [Dehalococcoidales bacterium]|nr:hypothetical protein [Dehalococcoidales bacterium]
MKKGFIILAICCLMLIILLTTSCNGQGTTTTSAITTSTTSTTTTSTTTPTTTTTTTTTQTQTTTTTETTETLTVIRYYGTISGTWTGYTTTGEAVDGTFTVEIDEDGNITGTFSGDYEGTIEGEVDNYGNLNAVGAAIMGGQNIQFIWQGTVTLYGSTIAAGGTWSGSLASGTFNGAGEVAY